MFALIVNMRCSPRDVRPYNALLNGIMVHKAELAIDHVLGRRQSPTCATVSSQARNGKPSFHSANRGIL